MVLYKCFRCGYNTIYKTNFKNHLNRKHICQPKLENISINKIIKIYKLDNICDYTQKSTFYTPYIHKTPHKRHMCSECGKQYSRSDSLLRHKRTSCKKNISNKKENIKLKKEISILKHENDKLKQLRENDKKEILDEVEKLILKNMNSKVTHINNMTNSNNQTINNNNIIINNYGEENVDYITDKILNKLLKHPNSSLVKLIKIKHFHPKHPENRNIRITNKKLPFAEVIEDKKWKLKKKNTVLEELLDKNFILLDNHYEEKELDLQKKYKNKYEKYQQQIDNNEKFRNDKKIDIEIEILNSDRNIEI